MTDLNSLLPSPTATVWPAAVHLDRLHSILLDISIHVFVNSRALTSGSDILTSFAILRGQYSPVGIINDAFTVGPPVRSTSKDVHEQRREAAL
ncbi:hypothetical protein [Streptomyces sp. NPDC088847]|uniref:hypothetical protein n=1 Tax=Streptomyces sp. NPDC088847 TaxID=3365909 RepID=UPI003830B189